MQKTDPSRFLCRPVFFVEASFSGRDWFTWQIQDGSKQGDYATAFIDVQPVTVSMKLTVGGASDPAPRQT